MSDLEVEAARPPSDAAVHPFDSGGFGDVPQASGGRGAEGRSSERFRSPEALVQGFSCWAYKCEPPDNPELLTRLAEAAIESRAPLAFVLYWGRGPAPRSPPPSGNAWTSWRALPAACAAVTHRAPK
jgi:hypothetical protein